MSIMQRSMLIPCLLWAACGNDNSATITGLPDADIVHVDAARPDAAVAVDAAPPSVPLVRIDPEAPGANCPAGGNAVHVGLDTNDDGILEDSEITSTSYLCNPVVVCPCWDLATAQADVQSAMAGDADTYTTSLDVGSGEASFEIDGSQDFQASVDFEDIECEFSWLGSSVIRENLTPDQYQACFNDVNTLAGNNCAANEGQGTCSVPTAQCVYIAPTQSQCVECTSDDQCTDSAKPSCETPNPQFYVAGDPVPSTVNTCVECSQNDGFNCAAGTYCSDNGSCIAPDTEETWLPLVTSDYANYGAFVTACADQGARVPTVYELESAMTAQFNLGTTFSFTFVSGDWYTSDNVDSPADPNTDFLVVASGTVAGNDYWGNGNFAVCIKP